jgi:hypothetical protein
MNSYDLWLRETVQIRNVSWFSPKNDAHCYERSNCGRSADCPPELMQIQRGIVCKQIDDSVVWMIMVREWRWYFSTVDISCRWLAAGRGHDIAAIPGSEWDENGNSTALFAGHYDFCLFDHVKGLFRGEWFETGSALWSATRVILGSLEKPILSGGFLELMRRLEQCIETNSDSVG